VSSYKKKLQKILHSPFSSLIQMPDDDEGMEEYGMSQIVVEVIFSHDFGLGEKEP